MNSAVVRRHGWVAWGAVEEEAAGGHVFVSLTLPADGRVRGAVALVPAFGTEAEFSHRATVYLAARLAERGVAALRVDPPGCGDSADSGGDDPSLWPGMLAEVARAVVGPEVPLGFAGLRTGALVAAEAAAAHEATCLLLWDPVASVRTHLRAASVLLGVATGYRSPSRGSVAVPGARLSAATVAGLGRLSLRPAGASPVPTLALLRADDPASAARSVEVPDAEVLTLAHAGATVAPVHYVSVIPGPELDRAAQWAAARFDGPVVRVEPRLEPRVEAVSPEGHAYVETVEEVGPDSVVVVTTRSAAPPSSRSPWVVTTHAANYPHHGPGRLWVAMARELVADGVSSTRWDRRGVGDTGTPEADEVSPLYSAARFDDIEEVLASIDAPDDEITLVGLCSGGLASALTTLAHPRMRLVYIAPQVWNTDLGEVTRVDLERAGWDLARAAPPSRPQTGPVRRGYEFLRRHHPYPLWVLLSRRGLTQIPRTLLVPLARAGVRTTFCFPRLDWPLFSADHGPRGLREAREHGWDAEFVHLSGAVDDHNLWSPAYLEQITTVVRRTARRPWTPVAGGPRPTASGRDYPFGVAARRRDVVAARRRDDAGPDRG